MTKGTKIFRVIICILLALTMLCSALLVFLYAYESYDISVAGVTIRRNNADDVLGDGTVSYDPVNKIVTFNNATIETSNMLLYSSIDLNVQLIGENKLTCTNEVYSIGLFAGDYQLYKDLTFFGDGSLVIEVPNTVGEAVGICADDLMVAGDVTVNIAGVENNANGIVCGNTMVLVGKASVTVNNGPGTNSVAVRVRGNALFEAGTSLNVSVAPGTAEICKGFNVSGDLFLGKDAVLNVSVDDADTNQGDAIRVSGLMELGIGSNVTASAKNAPAIACYGTIEANEGAAISAVSENNAADVFCSGPVVDYGATFDGEVDAIGGIHDRH